MLKQYDKTDLIDDEAIEIIQKRAEIQKGDLLFSNTGTVGKMALVLETPTNDYVDEVLDKFGFAVQLVPDGSYYFTTTVTVEPTPEFYGWIFSLGHAVEIIGPDLIRRMMYSKVRSQEYTYREKKYKRNPSVRRV